MKYQHFPSMETGDMSGLDYSKYLCDLGNFFLNDIVGNDGHNLSSIQEPLKRSGIGYKIFREALFVLDLFRYKGIANFDRFFLCCDPNLLKLAVNTQELLEGLKAMDQNPHARYLWSLDQSQLDPSDNDPIGAQFIHLVIKNPGIFSIGINIGEVEEDILTPTQYFLTMLFENTPPPMPDIRPTQYGCLKFGIQIDGDSGDYVYDFFVTPPLVPNLQ